MILKDLELTNFRNHKKFKTELDPEITLIIGPNAAGKTNLIEAIYMASTTKSFKAKYDKDVIEHSAYYARIESNMEDEDLTRLEVFVQKNPKFENASTKKTKLNKVSKALHKYAGTLKAVLFSPEDIEMLMGSPASRRKYLDAVLYETNAEYKKVHNEYLQAVKQRNKVLEKIRDFGKGYDELGYWNIKIVQNGVLIQSYREIMLNKLKEGLISYGIDLNNEDTLISLEYFKSEITPERLHEYQSREIAAKSTLIGPHRDDFLITLNKFPVGEFGSRGQQRSAVLALKLAETDFIEKETGKRPILLLDDVFSELDERHKEAVIKTVKLQQTVITATQKTRDLPETTGIIELGSFS